MDGWTDGRVRARVVGSWMDGQTEGVMDGQMDSGPLVSVIGLRLSLSVGFFVKKVYGTKNFHI